MRAQDPIKAEQNEDVVRHCRPGRVPCAGRHCTGAPNGVSPPGPGVSLGLRGGQGGEGWVSASSQLHLRFSSPLKLSPGATRGPDGEGGGTSY